MKSIFFISNNVERIIPEQSVRKIFNKFDLELDYFPLHPAKFDKKEDISTYQLLKCGEVEDYITNNNKDGAPNILVFKNSNLIERLCQKKGYNLLSSPSSVSSFLENKISQSEFLETYKLPRPFTSWGVFEDIDFYRVASKTDVPFVLQFGRGHSGISSLLIESQNQFRELCHQFPQREIRCTKLIDAEIGTINACVSKKGLHLGAPSLQITGVKGLTQNKLSTVGNDWGYIEKLFIENNLEDRFISFMEKVGNALGKVGYLGIFGLDFTVEEQKKKDNFKVLEINARFPASLVSETEMAYKDDNPLLFLLHIKEFLPRINYGRQINGEKLPYYQGSRLIYRDLKTNVELTSRLYTDSVYKGKSEVKAEAIKKITNNVK